MFDPNAGPARARTAGNAAYVSATAHEIGELKVQRGLYASGLYPAKCMQRGYDEWPQIAEGFVAATQAETRLDGTNLLVGGCNTGSCQTQFGYLGGKWAKARKEMCLDPRDSMPFVREQHLCAQTTWDKKNKEACCAGTISTRAKCDPTWCPMSKGCKDSQATIKHFSTAIQPDNSLSEVPGGSELLSPSGRQWCLEAPGSCDVAKLNFCAKNPTADACKCIRPKQQQDYKELMDTMNRFGIPTPSAAHYCWYKGCHGTDGEDILKTQAIIKGIKDCPGGNLTVCNQIIEIQENSSNNIISGQSFSSMCSGGLPEHKQDSGPEKAGGESIDGSSADTADTDVDGDSASDDDAGDGASNWFLLAVGAVGLLAVIMLIVMMFKA